MYQAQQFRLFFVTERTQLNTKSAIECQDLENHSLKFDEICHENTLENK